MVRADDYPKAIEILKQTPAKDFLSSEVSEERPTLDYGRSAPKLPISARGYFPILVSLLVAAAILLFAIFMAIRS